MRVVLQALVLLGLLSGGALARPDQSASLRPEPATSANLAIADQIGLVIQARMMHVDHAAPTPGVDCRDASLVEKRVAALAELDAFTRITVSGLVNAAPSLELRAMMDERLAPVINQHRSDMAAALAALRELPLVREKPALSADVARLTEKAAQAY